MSFVQFLALGLLLLDELAVCDLSEVFVCGIDGKLFVLEDGLESGVFGVGLEVAF